MLICCEDSIALKRETKIVRKLGDRNDGKKETPNHASQERVKNREECDSSSKI